MAGGKLFGNLEMKQGKDVGGVAVPVDKGMCWRVLRTDMVCFREIERDERREVREFPKVFKALFGRDRMVLEVPYESYIGYGGTEILAFGLDGVPWDSEGSVMFPNRGKVGWVGMGFNACCIWVDEKVCRKKRSRQPISKLSRLTLI